MKDKYHRDITYVRISITDRCNFRCGYCMPKEGISFETHEEILTYEEILKISKAFIGLGIYNFKITGGEPLLRKGAGDFIKDLKDLEGCQEVTLTTNGYYLSTQLSQLKKSGVRSINISLDTLNATTFEEITGVNALYKVKEGIAQAIEEGFRVKLNMLVMPQTNQQELISMIQHFSMKPVAIRFIEMMPIGLGREYEPVTQEVLISTIEKEFGTLTPYHKKMGNGPATYYTLKDCICKIGFISAISHSFCDRCNRFRLTSTGFLKTCLQYDHGVDLKTMLRTGCSEEELKHAIYEAIYNKPQNHEFVTHQEKVDTKEKKLMSQVGG